MLKITVFKENENVQERHIEARADKPARTIRSQVAYVHLGGKFPVEMSLNLDDGQAAYPAGEYEVQPESFQVNQYGSLEIRRFDFFIAPVKNVA